MVKIMPLASLTLLRLYRALTLSALILVPFNILGSSSADAADAEDISKYLSDFELNSLTIGNHIVDCRGLVTNVDLVGNTSFERPFRFLGIVDQNKRRVRWICRRGEEDSALSSVVDVEFEFVMTPDTAKVWQNGLLALDARSAENRENFPARFPSEIRFHPMPMVMKGYGGFPRNANARTTIRLKALDEDDMIKIQPVLQGQRVTYLSSKRDNARSYYVLTLDATNSHFPKRIARYVVQGNNPVIGDESLIHEADSTWIKVDNDMLVPETIEMTRWREGKKSPRGFTRVKGTMEWKIQMGDMDDYFEFDQSEFGHPVWNEEILKRLGPHNRMPKQMIKAMRTSLPNEEKRAKP